MNKIQNMLIGIALGDAFGAGYEFAFKERQQFHDVDLSKYRTHNNPDFAHELGMYTDDTQMSIAVAELLISKDKFNAQNIAQYFVDAFKRDPINGYARGFQSFLKSIESGEEFLEKIKPHSQRNGAAMRSVPLGIIDNIETLVKYATINAKTTHDTSKGIASSVAVGLISHYNLYKQRSPDLQTELIPIIKNIDKETATYLTQVSQMKEFDTELLLGEKHKDKGVPCDGMRTVGAVMYILDNYYTPEDILIESVRLGGDTDSVASIALGIHMINDSIENLPRQLYEGLTNHKFGKDYLLALGRRLEE